MSYYPPIEKFKGYRYSPFKDNPLYYLDFICINTKVDDGYSMMVIYDNLEGRVRINEGDLWHYGEIHTVDWHVDLKPIEITSYDLQLAKLQGL